MTLKLVTGDEPMLQPALDYLESRGIGRSEVTALTVTSAVGKPLRLTVELLVRDPDEVTT